ncbi:hypothetical protein [Ulvibacterium sp.]|uniref:hypothetical protein n=1 Tax=Ulvibacterium sp. TaxID=2665914 RepID=UPI003BA8E300
MPKKLTLKQRIHAGFILAIAFLLVLASNRLNRRNFSTVEHTVNSVFEDRVVAQDYIYRLNNLFHQKEMSLEVSEREELQSVADDNIVPLFENFAKTKLTQDESVYFKRLKENYWELQKLEKAFFADQEPKAGLGIKEMEVLLKKINENLNRLSEVQLSESLQLTQLSQKSLKMNQLLSMLEVVFLVIIGILFLLIVFHREKSNTALVKEDV